MDQEHEAVAFFDVDGTLVWRDFEKMSHGEQDVTKAVAEIRPSEGVYDAFYRMRERGNLTFICTGRPIPFIMPSLRELRPDGFIAAAGAYVSIGDEVVRDERIPQDLAVEVVRRFAAAGIDVILESNTRNVEVRPSGGEAVFGKATLVRSAEEFEPLAAERAFCKFCTGGVSLAELAPVRDFVDEHFTVADLQGGILEFSLRGVDKGTGIEAALTRLGHARESTYAFGDSENDLPMAGAVETFVAMGNALPVVKERADYVTASAANDGVPAALAHFGLI